MAKLDDFGRPIYETAEEYNKAHKGGVCPRPYDSPIGENHQPNATKNTYRTQSVAQRHANQAGMKKTQAILVAMGVFFVALSIGIVFTMVGLGVRDSDIGYGTEENRLDGYGEYFEEGQHPLPEDFANFLYNGESYTIPTNYQEITKMGFSVVAYTEKEMLPGGFEEILSLDDKDGYMKAMIRINNHDKIEIPLAKCTVDYFYMENPAIFDREESIPDFKFGNGLTFESTFEDIEAYLGVPYYHYKDHSEEGCYYDHYQWMYYKEIDDVADEIHCVSITFYNDEMESISIEKAKEWIE